MTPFRLLAILLLALAGAIPAGALAQQKDCAVVLLHGKWGSPRAIMVFGRRLEPACEVRALEMPWAQRRAYDQPYPAALRQIEQAVAEFRDKGFRRVIIMGQSFGANAVLAYLASGHSADAAVAIVPGHSPRHMYDNNIGRAAVDRARELVAAGQGSTQLTMEDLNGGQRASYRMSAEVLLSYFDPAGLGDIPTSSAAIHKPLPLLWIVGANDPLARLGPAFAYDKIAPHPASRYITVQAGHLDAPEVAAPQILEWIAQLP
jgi:pimeloyl-ACP methyl ester carboxylesterase